MSEVSITVVVPLYRDHDSLSHIMSGWAGQTCQDFELLLVNDGGDRSLEEPVLRYKDMINLRYFYHEPETGAFRAAACRNYGFRYGRGRRLLCCDADCIPPGGLVWEHLEHGLKNPQDVVLGLRRHIHRSPSGQSQSLREWSRDERFGIRHPDYRQPVLAYEGTGRAAQPCRSYRWCWSPHMSIPMEAGRKLGGFDERFTEYPYEDQEFGFRLQRAGYPLVARFDLHVYHRLHDVRPKSPVAKAMLAEALRRPDQLVRNGGPIVPEL